MHEFFAWLTQARSDYVTAEREFQWAAEQRPPVLCHAVAKYQQALEKFIKAIVSALRDAGVVGVHPVGYDHHVQNHLRLLRRIPGGAAGRSIQNHLTKFLNRDTLHGISTLEDFAPRRPAPGAPHERNTEYPYNVPGGDWTCPAVPDSFSLAEVQEFKKLLRRISYYTNNIVATLHHLPS
jgi:hypothetical protein